jgi:hypothetical protein
VSVIYVSSNLSHLSFVSHESNVSLFLLQNVQVAYDVGHAVAAARAAGIVGAEAFLQERLGDLRAAGQLYIQGVKA